MRKLLTFAPLLAITITFCSGQNAGVKTASFPLDSVAGLRMWNARVEVVSYRDRRAIHFLPPVSPAEGLDPMAVLADTHFKNGTIEVDVAGFPGKTADAGNRGFIGIGFRVKDGQKGEYLYLRPTNGRADDQLRRNHAVQYMSLPEYPWNRLREENPGVYESYADLEPGVWTHMKIEVNGSKARLYINGASQPCLIVNDLKLGDSEGQIALWAVVGTEAYFSNLRVY